MLLIGWIPKIKTHNKTINLTALRCASSVNLWRRSAKEMKSGISIILTILFFVYGCTSELITPNVNSESASSDDLVLSDLEINDPTQSDPIKTNTGNEIELREFQIEWLRENLPGSVILDDPIVTVIDGETITLSDRVITADFGLLKCILIMLPNGRKRVLYFDVNLP